MQGHDKKNFRQILVPVAALIVIAGVVFLPGLIENLLRVKLRSGLPLTFDDLHLQLQTRTLVLSDIRFRDSLHKASVYIPVLRLEGFSVFGWLLRKQVIIEKAVFSHPEIKIRIDTFSIKGSAVRRQQVPVLIGQLNVWDGVLLVQEMNCSLADTIFQTRFDIEMHRVAPDGLSRIFHFGQLAFDSASFSLKKGKYIFPNKLYRLTYQTGLYHSSGHKLDFDVLSLTSEYSKYEMGRRTGAETDWLNLLFTNVELSGLDLRKLLCDTALVARRLQVAKMEVEAFKDKRLPFPQKPDSQLPMDLINSLPFGLHIDSLICQSGDIEYAERVAGSNDAGVVTFSDLKFKINQISNRLQEIKDTTTIEASALVMQQVLLKARFEIPNGKYNVAYCAQGTLAPAPMAAFNPVVRHNAGVVVQRGVMKSFAFYFRYDKNQSHGRLQWQYDSLKVLVFDRANYRSRRFQSFLVNQLVLKRSNLKGDRNYQTGRISFVRDKKKSIFNYWWKSLASGLKDIAL